MDSSQTALELFNEICNVRSKALRAQKEDIELDDLLENVNCDALKGRVCGRQEVIDNLSELIKKWSDVLINSKGADD